MATRAWAGMRTPITTQIDQSGTIGVSYQERRPDMLLPLVERLVVLAVEIHPVAVAGDVGVEDGDPASCQNKIFIFPPVSLV